MRETFRLCYTSNRPGACSSSDTKLYNACIFIQINLPSPEEQVASSKLLLKVFPGSH